MSKRYPSGFISTFYDPLKNPNAPTIGTATAGDASASVAFTAPSNVGGSAITEYNARSTPGNVTASAASSPINVTGLTNGTAYTFAVWAINSYGPSVFSASSGSVTPFNPSRGVFGGGGYPQINVIQYITIETTGNATDFGDLTTVDSFYNMACSSSTRGIFAGGFNGGAGFSNVINYITIATTGNATDFGDLLPTVNYEGGGCSNSTRGLFIGKNSSGSDSASIQYITIASTGNGTNFGNLTTTAGYAAAASNTTRAIFGLCGGGSTTNYVTIASTGNATDFGNMTITRNDGTAGCASATRALFAGASGSINVIDFCTIATTGSFADFGDLVTGLQACAATSNSTRGVFAGGYIGPVTSAMTYVTMATTGNSTSFGNLSAATYGLAGCSSAHGGL